MRNGLIISILALGVIAVPAANAQEAGPVITSPTTTAVVDVPARTLARGLKFDATFKNQISSKSDKVGDIITGVIVDDVKDASGVVIFPAKSTANVEVMDIEGMRRNQIDGQLALVIRSVNVGNKTFRIQPAKEVAAGPVEAKNPTWTREPKKMDAPASAEVSTAPVAITGVVGRAPKGTVSGANLMVAPGTAVTFELSEAVTVTS